MATIIPYKTIFISNPTGDGGILIENDLKILADLDADKTSKLQNITANYALSTDVQTVASNLTSETAARIAGDNNLQSEIDSILNGTVNGIFTNLTTLNISADTISGNNLYLVGNAYSMGERLARISEIGTGGGSGSVVSYSEKVVDGSVVSTITPSGNYDVIIYKNCNGSMTIDDVVNWHNVANGQTVKIICENTYIYGFTLPTGCYSSITQSDLGSIWGFTGSHPNGAMFELTKFNNDTITNGSIKYTPLYII